MKSRLFATGLAFLSAGLVACGGGGGGGGNVTPATPTPQPTSTSTPAPKPSNNPYGCVGQPPFTSAAARRSSISHPVAAGDSFAYSGKLNRVYAQSAPCVQPTATASASISVNVTDSATTAPNGQSATDSQSVETDNYPTQSTTITTDQTLQNNATGFVLFADSSSDSSGNSIATAYNVAQVLDKGPGTAGSWQNDPTAIVTEQLADGTHISRRLASDGSYTDTETFPDGSQSTINVNGAATGKPLDGSGTYTIAGVQLTYAAPAGGSITETSSSGKTSTYPAWFTISGGALVTDSFTDNGTQTIDTNCALAPTFPTQGTQIVETSSTTDPVLGYTDLRVTTSYNVDGYGAVCVAITDILKSYYDYQLDTTKIYRSQNGQPNSVNTITEYLTMTSPTSALPASRTRTSEAGVSPVTVAAHVAAIQHQRAIALAVRAHALHTILMHQRAKGAVQ